MAKSKTLKATTDLNTESVRAQYLDTLGKDIFGRLSYGLPDKEIEPELMEDGRQLAYSSTVMKKIAAGFTNHVALIAEMKDQMERYRKAAKAYMLVGQAEFLDWSERLIRDTSLELGNSDNDMLKLASSKSAIRGTAEQWLLNLCTLSGNAIKGQKAQGDKPGKASMFEDEKRGKKKGGFKLNTENYPGIIGRASVNYIIQDENKVLESAIIEIVDCARLFDLDDLMKAAEIFDRLTDLKADKRFGFSRECVLALVQARTMALLFIRAKEMKEKAETNKEQAIKSLAMQAADEERLEKIRFALDNQRESETSQPERAPLPMAVNPNVAVTWESKTIARIEKQGRLLGIPSEQVNAHSIIAGMMSNASQSGQAITEDIFNEVFEGKAVQSYLITLKNDLIKSGVLKTEDEPAAE